MQLFMEDVRDIGIERILLSIARFEEVMVYAGNGMAVPGGPLPWE